MLMERQTQGLLEGLWEPPGATLDGAADARAALARALARRGLASRLEPTGIVVRHRITHRAVEAELWRATPRAAVPASPGLRFVATDAPRVALTALARHVARAIGPDTRSPSA